MLECILYQRNKQERNDPHRFNRNLQIYFHGSQLIAAQSHQLDVIIHELDLAFHRYQLMVRLIERIPQQIAQLPDTFLRRILVYLDQAGNIIQGIKEKMRIQLVLQPSQFRLGVFLPFLFQTHLHIAPAYDITESHGTSNH